MISIGRWCNSPDTLADILAGKPAFFSWSTLLSGQPPDPQRLTRFISILPVLDYAALQPGKVPSDFIRNSAKDLGLTPENGVKVRLTGRIPLEDDDSRPSKKDRASTRR